MHIAKLRISLVSVTSVKTENVYRRGSACHARSVYLYFWQRYRTQFSDIQLTATVDPAEATGTYEWSSSNEDILTVDNSGNVTGVRQGTATVTVSFISAVGGSEVSASKDVTVTATKDATDQALVYYLLDPTKDAQLERLGSLGKNIAWHRNGEYHRCYVGGWQELLR